MTFFLSHASSSRRSLLFQGNNGAGFRAVKVFAKNTLARNPQKNLLLRERGRFFAKPLAA